MQHWSKKEKHEGINRNAEFRNRLHFTHKPDLGDPARKEGISNHDVINFSWKAGPHGATDAI